MKIDSDKLRTIIEMMKIDGYEVGVRDISYVFLTRIYEEAVYAFRAVFGNSPDVPFGEYSKSRRVEALIALMEKECPPEKEKDELPSFIPREEEKEEDTGLSYDEIKKGLEEDLASLIALRDQTNEDGIPMLEAKEMATVVGRIADIRVKLTEQFGTKQKGETQRVVVVAKYNDICPYCNHEISRR